MSYSHGSLSHFTLRQQALTALHNVPTNQQRVDHTALVLSFMYNLHTQHLSLTVTLTVLLIHFIGITALLPRSLPGD